MEKNYLKANFINLKFSIAIFSLFFISLGANAQVVKEFQQRTSTYSSSKKIYNIKGDFTMIGNTNLSLWSYGNNTNNSNNYMIFVDEDNDDSTDNSSAAVLEFSNENGADPNCSNIVYAGLYWSGRTDNSSTTNDKRKIKVKGPNNNEYQTFTANQNDILYPGPSNMYAAYAEVTDLVRSNGTGEYWVADMALTQGNGGATGYYGGWGMIVIYENSQMNWRDVTIFDGYAHVEGNTVANYQLPVSGFNTAQSGPVNMKMGIMAGEGDVGIAGDYFQIKKNNNNSWLSLSHDQNSTNNFFNSSIENNGTNRTPNLSNNTGIDISMFNIPNQGNSVIANNQTSTTFRYGSTQDTYSIFSIAMSVDAYIPEIEGITSLTEINSNTAGNPPYSVEPGEEISYKIELKNKGTENIEDVKVVVPVPYNVDYVNNSLNTNFYFSPTPSPNNVYFDPTLGATGSIVWEISEIPLATNTNDVLADLAVSFKVTENCTILSNACPGYDVITFNGNISGRGAITGTTFENKDLIRGYETEGACLGEPITSPFEISVDASNFRAENCGNSDEARRFIYCNREEPIKISEINSGFPSGTRFYNESPVDINSEEYTINNPIPNTTGSTEYYAIIPGAEDCAIPFTIEITSISTVPDTENITYCLNEEANPLDATASNSNYDLYYYTSETDTTPEMQFIPSTSQAGEFTYYVAEGESASCISPNKAEIKVKVLGVPEVAAPQNLNPDACGTELIDKTIPEISSEFTLISSQLFEELGGSIPGDADIDAIEYRDEVVQSNPVIYNRVFKISYECGSFELTQQITLNDLRDSLTPEFTITQPTCENVAGKIEVISNNASSYSLDGENFQSSNIFTGLIPGNYVVYIQNETGCVSDASAQIEIVKNLGTPNQPQANVSQQPTCEDTIGTISVTTEAGISYTLLDENQNPLTNSIANGTFSGLSAGKYFVQASNGDCEAVSEVLEVEENLGTPGTPLAEVSQQPTCEDTTGIISVITETGIYYTLLDENQDPLTNSIANGTFSGLSAGKYFVEASNGDCEAISEVLEIEENLGTPGAPLAEVSQQPTCEDTTGTISVTTEAGISYSLLDENQDPLTNSIANSTFSGLAAGKYFVQASNGDCEVVSEVLEIEENLGTPNQPQAKVSQQPSCDDTTGTISVSTETGISYILLDENKNPLTNSIANETFAGLSAGKYFIQASNGDCEAISEVLEIEENLGTPGAPLAEVSQQPTCEDTTGTISVTTEAGISYTLLDENQDPLTNSIANETFAGLSAGKYFIQASNGDCEAISEVLEIEENLGTPGAPLAEVSQQPNCEDTTGTISVTTEAGISYTLLDENQDPLTNSIANSTFSELSAGKYFVQASNGDCEAVSEVLEIEENLGTPVAPLAEVSQQPTCEDTTGIISVTTEAGISYTLLDENQDPLTKSIAKGTFSGLSAGKYFVEASNGDCEAISEVLEIEENLGTPGTPLAEVSQQPTCEDTTGTISVTTKTGISYILLDENQDSLTNSIANGTFRGLSAGKYFVQATNGDCEAISEVLEIIKNEGAPIAPIITSVTNTTCSLNNGIIEFELTEDLTFILKDSQQNEYSHENGSFTDLASGIYYLVAKNNDCEAKTEVTIDAINDNEAPEIAQLNDISVNTDEGLCGAVVNFDIPEATDNCGIESIIVTEGLEPGSEFPLGSTTVTYAATDNAGNTATSSFKVIVTDNEAPVITCIDNIVTNAAEGQGFAIVEFNDATATDNCEVTVTQTAGPASGSEFPLGTTTITFEAEDKAGNVSQCSFTIIVKDSEAPSLECPENISQPNDAGICGAVVSFETPTGFDNSGEVEVVQTGGLPSGSEFPVGISTIEFTATDAEGNSATCSFTIEITDDEAPEIAEVNDISVNTDYGLCGAVVNFDIPEATYNCGIESVVLTEGLEPGSEFPLGSTTVTYTATDNAGNTATSSFKVIVIDNEAPVITCIDNIVANAAEGKDFAIVDFNDATATDNCEVTVTQTAGPASGSEFPLGTTTITFEAEDKAGNVSECSFTVTVNDSEAPSLECTENISQPNDADTCGATVTFETPTGFDNSGEVEVVQTGGLPSGSEFPVGISTIELTATDAEGNTATCSFTIEITDDEAPKITQLNDISLNTDEGICGAVVNFDLPEATDNCGIESVILTEGLESGSEFPLGSTTVTYTASDNAGNTVTSSFKVIVTDNEAPVITCIDNIVANAAEGKDFAIVDFNDATATDNCEVTVTQTAGPASGSEFPLGTTTITFEAEDKAGNVSECSFTVTVNDSEAPSLECTENISQPNDADTCGATVTFETPTGFDNSGEVEVVQTGGLPSGSEFPVGISTIEFTASDAEGNSTTCSFTIEITDDEAPEITQLNDISVNTDEGICGAVVNFDLPEATDNCDIESVLLTEGLESGSEFPVGSTTVTYTATDNAGNTATSSFKVIVTDNEAPVITCIDNIVTNAAEGQDFAIVDFNDATATDNCEVTVTQTAGPVSGSEFPLGTTTITFEAEDKAGNVSERSFTITVKDSEAPTLECPENISQPNDADICGAIVSFETPTAFDNSGEVQVVQTGGLPSGSEFPVGISTIEFTATDAEGNSATCSFTIEITDDEAPEIAQLNDISVNTDKGICGAVVNFDIPEATDNCSIESVTVTEGLEPGSEFPLGNTTVTYTATDSAGNTATSSFKVIVTDNQAPIIANVEAINTTADANACGAMVEIIAPLASDNCSVGMVNGTRDDSQPLDAEYPVGTTTITWTVTDDNGNEAEPVIQTVTVNDNQAPVIECPENMIFSTESGVDFATVIFENPLASDNCEVNVEQTSGFTSGSQFPIGTNTVTFTATDTSGNTSQCSFDIIVEDTEDPTLECPSDIVRSTDSGICGAIVEFEIPEGFDNSGNVTVEQTEGLASGEVFPVGTTTITFTTSDEAGNTVSCSFEITVVDDEAPVIEDKNDITLNTDPDLCGAIVDYELPSATDDCGLESIELTEGLVPGSEFPLGETRVTYTAIDVNGNSVNSSFTVTVIDNEAPVIACPEDIQLNVEFGTETVVVNYATISATDNCSETSIELIEGYASGEEFPLGKTIVTYEITDASGNTSNCSFTVIVEEEPEETPPAPTAPQVDLIQPDCVTPTGVILINTEDGLTYSIDGENYVAVEEFTELEPGTYQVTTKDEFDQISDATIVTLVGPIASEIETTTISLCIDDSTFDLFELLEGEYDTSGVWVDTEETGALTQGFIDPAILAIGTYTFEYQLNNGICDSTTEVTVSINDDCVVLPCSLEDIRSSISKAVTPNGDNRNDYFTIDFASDCGFTYDLMIFNRWGNKIYEATNYQNDWDGYSTNSATSSNQMPSGTYFYILEIRNSGFDPIQGYIYLGTK
jgi:gliding motility-associated-like protein/uncharacterized repeat protein (TIGR01451 family)